ncbi:MAG TPA: trypsin-like peptidase domain-containing protein [Chitinophagaceae bacterium]|nr:trypsin-like peptidase domain-containing protein [Chitinophagaceae bacterium]
MKIKQILTIVLLSASTTVGTMFAYSHFSGKPRSLQAETTRIPANYAGLFDSNNNPGEAMADFTKASQSAVPAVVHITTVITNTAGSQKRSPFADLFGDDFDDFFGGPNMRSVPQRASGSGVIVSGDGYIVTNNHVIDEASEIKVTLSNKKTYTAKLIGTDPSSDLAMLKIEEKDLPFILYGNSDLVKVGQWVLAVGYPLNLETTVTAGIISAKSRSLGLNARRSNTPIESFIQTDAAVNQGNSGGALVNTSGELVGIVSAIASPTGAYAGYSYAIPVNIVKKIINDLLQYGTVQRAYLGVSYLPDNVPDSEKDKIGFKEGIGVYVREVAKDGAAANSGLKEGDYITKINGVRVISGSEMVEQVASYKPGDKITLTYQREGKEFNSNLTLKNSSGSYGIVKTQAAESLGAEFETLPASKAKQYGFNGGVVVKRIKENGLIDAQTRMRDGFIIIKANGQEVKSIDDLANIMQRSSGRLVLDGLYPGYDGAYSYVIEQK